jgi:hypothetical protein
MTRRRKLDSLTTGQLWLLVAKQLLRLAFGAALFAALLLLLALV